jgi:hypothetical protein
MRAFHVLGRVIGMTGMANTDRKTTRVGVQFSSGLPLDRVSTFEPRFGRSRSEPTSSTDTQLEVGSVF